MSSLFHFSPYRSERYGRWGNDGCVITTTWRNIPTVCQHFFIWPNGHPPFNFSLFLCSTTNNWPVQKKKLIYEICTDRTNPCPLLLYCLFIYNICIFWLVKKKKNYQQIFSILFKIKMTIQLVFVWLKFCCSTSNITCEYNSTYDGERSPTQFYLQVSLGQFRPSL